MKRLLLILALFGLILNISAQSYGEYDYLEVDEQITFRGDSLAKFIQDQTSGTTLDGQNGVYKNGNFFEFGTNTLIKNTELPGGLYNLTLGTVANKLGTFTVNGQDIQYTADNSIILAASGISCEWDGSLLICGNDTIATLDDVRTEIESMLPVLPFNYKYTFNSATTDTRPGAGLFKLNSTVLSAVTQIYVDNFDNDNVDQGLFLNAPDTGSYITIKSSTYNYALYKMTGGVTDGGNYVKYNVSYEGHNGILSGLSTIDLELSNSTGTGGGGVADSVFQTITADTVYATQAVVLPDGTPLVGADTSGKISVDTLEANVHIVGQGATKDTLTGAISLDDALKVGVDYITTDTIGVNNDTITAYELLQTVRKTLYPNDYASYLPNDSIYTTPSITLNVPTKILIPTAIKYTRNWALFDKGGSDFALQYQGSDSSIFHITMTTSMRTSASNVVFEIFMYKNGIIEPGIAVERKIGTGADVGAISVTGAFHMTENDYIEVYILVDVTTTVTFSKTSIVIKEDGLITN